MTSIEIVETREGAPLEQARALIVEYAESRGFPLSWQGFDEEVASLPGRYAPPDGRLLLGLVNGRPGGCVGLRRIDGESCEMKRLYVQPAARGQGLGRLLAERVIEEARGIGYRAMLLDTLDRMEEAGGLYRALGFHTTEPYRYNPLPDVVYLRLAL